MDFGLAFSYPFKDPEWVKKIGVIGLITIIPIFGQIVLLGWTLEITRRVLRKEPVSLPDIDLGEQFSLGLRGLVVGLGYALPIIIFELPISLIGAFQGNGDQTAQTLYAVVSVCCGGLVVLYSLVLAVWLPAAYANMVARNEISAGFNFSRIFALLQAAPGAYLLVFVANLLGAIIVPLGLILCIIGVVFTATYFNAVMGDLYGQAYNEATQNSAVLA